MSEGIEKIHFELNIEEDGFPPISIETLNGIRVTDDTFILENTPFFVTGIAVGDVIFCNKRSKANGWWFNRIEEESGNKAISIIFLDEKVEDSVFQRLKNYGCHCEYGEFGNLHMLAVCVFHAIDYAEIVEFLDKMEYEESISYAELCVS